MNKLGDVFRQAGDIISIDMESNSRGKAVVKFSHPYESVQAVAMFNGQVRVCLAVLYTRKNG